jgi:hypothetical protein
MRGIGNLAVDEVLEAVLHEQHDEDVLVDDHARGLVVGELGVELKTKLGEKAHRGLQVLDRQVDEDHSHLDSFQGRG